VFKKIDTDQALIVQGGVFKPVDVFEGPDGGLYVQAKGGYVRIYEKGATSAKGVDIARLHRDGDLYRDQFGRLAVETGKDRKHVRLVVTEDKPFLIEKD
jgi:hypothetical protein